MDSIQTSRPTRYAARVALLGLGCLAAVAGLACYALASGARAYVATGDSYPGPLTAVAEPVGYFVVTLAGAVCLGGVLFVVVTARPGPRGVIDGAAFRVHLMTERVAVVWLLGAIVMVAVQAASDSGVPVSRFVGSTALIDAIRASEMARAWIVVAICAGVVACALRLVVRWIGHCLLVVPMLIGVVAAPVSGNAGSGPDHDYASSAVIVLAAALAALAGLKLASAINPSGPSVLRRVQLIEIACGALAVVYGVMLLWVLLGPGSLTGSAYGRAAIAAGATLVAVLGTDVAMLMSSRIDDRLRARIRMAGALAIIGVIALTASMATQTAPRLLAHAFTAWDVFLGYSLPEPPSVLTLLTVWRFDTLIGVGALALAGMYLAGVVRLRRRGDVWPVGRLVAWLAGCLILLIASSSGVKAYGSAMFSVHMAEHMLLNMFIPVLLVLGGPVTLALRALPAAGDGHTPGPREWLMWLVHSKATAYLAHPVVAFVLFVASLYAVYFTPIFNTLVRYHWGHELMSLHFLIVGYVFYWGIIGIDPGPRRLPFLGRLGLLFAVMPFHAFFGIATMTMTSIIGGSFYRYVDLPWLSSIVGDQHLGGAIAWGSSELPVIAVVVALVAQWARQDRRAASRSDRHAESTYADDDLDAYNAMLRELARTRR
jgi:putative copper resistance protein D